MYTEYEILLSTINALAKTYIISFITNKNLDASAVCQLKVPRQVGLCLSCKVLEDESHLLLQCKTNDILRIYKLTSNSKNGKCCLYTQGIIRLVVNVKTLPLLIRYIYYWNLHFLICVIIPRARVTMAALLVVLLSKNLWVACLSSLSILSVPNAECSAGASCALSLMSTLFATKYFKKKLDLIGIISKRRGRKNLSSPAGNRTPVSRVTGGDTHHYTTEDLHKIYKLKYKYLCIYVGGSNPLFLALACISSQLTQLHVNCPENRRQFLLNIFLVQCWITFDTCTYKSLISHRCVYGPVAQWITRLTTDQKIPGSNPGRLGSFWTFL